MAVKAKWTVLLLLYACAHPSLRTVEAVEECAMRDAAPFDTAQLASLAGRSRLVEVITSLPANRAPYIWEEGTLTLSRPTAEQLAASRIRGVGHYTRRDLRLVGTWLMKGWTRGADGAEVDGDTLYLGCRDCLDGSPDLLQVTGMTHDRIWGTWRDDQTGIARAMDPITKQPLAELAGPFCAIRY
jgi:hypothetical protein